MSAGQQGRTLRFFFAGFATLREFRGQESHFTQRREGAKSRKEKLRPCHEGHSPERQEGARLDF
jgi:hypothetical protein